MTETFAFQAEISQLMGLIIHAFYSNKEIFLRELVANASDALDKYRYKRLQTDSSAALEENLCIRIRGDKEGRRLIIEDNGIGMTRQEMIDNLGTIARSGTKQFIQTLTETKDFSLIGQFGVGFYSAYLVADTVAVVSRTGEGDNSVYQWTSDANGTFTVSEVQNSEHTFLLDSTHGTQLILNLKEDQQDYLDASKLREILLKHSGFIGYAIELEVERTKEAEATPTAEEEGTVEDAEPDATPKPTITVMEWDHVNSQKPIWMRAPEEVSTEEYHGFYKAISNDWEEPEAFKHFKVEGQLEFRGLLYIPKRPPFDMFGREKRDHFKLYVRRVFITDSSEEFIPEWLSFVRGLVDSDDLPLNVSREMLQQSKITKVIKKNVLKKSIEMMTDLMNDHPDKFKNFYDNFSKNIKLGIYDEDEVTRKKLIPLLRFYSSSADSETRVSLADYVARMKEGQKHIYYLTGESVAAVRYAPFTESLRKKGIEVLYMVDTMDEYLTQKVTEYEGKRLVNVAKDGELEDLEKDATLEETYADLCAKFKEVLGDKVEKVVPSARLTDTPAIIVSSTYSWTANMERIMKAQALQNNTMSRMMASKKIMEINPTHRMIQAIHKKIEEGGINQVATNQIQAIYEGSMIASGFGLENPGDFIQRVYRMIEIGLGLWDEAETDTVPIATGENTEVSMEALD